MSECTRHPDSPRIPTLSGSDVCSGCVDDVLQHPYEEFSDEFEDSDTLEASRAVVILDAANEAFRRNGREY